MIYVYFHYNKWQKVKTLFFNKEYIERRPFKLFELGTVKLSNAIMIFILYFKYWKYTIGSLHKYKNIAYNRNMYALLFLDHCTDKILNRDQVQSIKCKIKKIFFAFYTKKYFFVQVKKLSFYILSSSQCAGSIGRGKSNTSYLPNSVQGL